MGQDVPRVFEPLFDASGGSIFEKVKVKGI
jgi:hypothetical protein